MTRWAPCTLCLSLPRCADPAATTLASSLATLQTLAAEAAGLNVTLHLRRTARNDDLIGGSLSAQAAFAASAGLRIAPALAYATIAGDSPDAISGLLGAGNASVVLLSSAWQAAGGRFSEGGLLVDTPPGALAGLREVHAAAVAAGAWIVFDAGYDSGSPAGRASELADAAFLVEALGV